MVETRQARKVELRDESIKRTVETAKKIADPFVKIKQEEEMNTKTYPIELQQQNLDSVTAILQELRRPIKQELIKERAGWKDKTGREHMISYVEWFTVADILDTVYPAWSYTVADPVKIDNFVSVTATINIAGVVRSGVGTGPISETGIKKAESDALKRAARMFGVARELYRDEDEGSSQPQATWSKKPAVSAPASQQAAPAKFPRDVVATSTDELITPRQLVAIRAIANAQGIDAEQESAALLNCELKDLSRRAASAFMDHLKSKAVMKPEYYNANSNTAPTPVKQPDPPYDPAGDDKGWSPEDDDSGNQERGTSWQDYVIPQGAGKHGGKALGDLKAGELWWYATKFTPRDGQAPQQELYDILQTVPEESYQTKK